MCNTLPIPAGVFVPVFTIGEFSPFSPNFSTLLLPITAKVIYFVVCCNTSPDNFSYTKSSRNLTWTILLDFSLTVKAATLIFISGRGLATSSAK